MGLCPLTRHSDASSKGSRGRSDTATIPYNGILAPRKIHSEVLTVPRRSMLWQLLPRQGICPVGSSRRDNCYLLDGMNYRRFFLNDMASHQSWLGVLGLYEGLGNTLFVGLYLLLVQSCLYQQHSLHYNYQLDAQHLFQRVKIHLCILPRA